MDERVLEETRQLEATLEALADRPFLNAYKNTDRPVPPRVRQMILNLARYFGIKPGELEGTTGRPPEPVCICPCYPFEPEGEEDESMFCPVHGGKS
jgi:hypothetical protein